MGLTGALLCLLGLLAAAPAGAKEPPYTLVSGQFEPGREPDGNSVLLDAPDGLILVDTGRHGGHQAAILAAARARGKPIAAIVNTHWHLDHSGGNAAIRAAFPGAPLYASTAIEGAVKVFFPRSRAAAAAFLKSGQASDSQRAEIAQDLRVMDDLASLRPTALVTASRRIDIAGRAIDVKLARYAATEGDVWLYLPDEKLVVAGDLVVAMVPFMDTACPQGWRKALDSIAATPFETLIPGHGAPMDKTAFLRWRTAFARLLDCADGDAAKDLCVAGWRRDAAEFVPAGDERRADEMVGYYVDTRLRASPEERARYCEGGAG